MTSGRWPPSQTHHLPITTRVSLNLAQAALIKKVKVSPYSILNLISTKYHKTNSGMEKPLLSAGMLFLSSTKLTDRQGMVEVAWPGYGFVRKDMDGVILHHHSKSLLSGIKRLSNHEVEQIANRTLLVKGPKNTGYLQGMDEE